MRYIIQKFVQTKEGGFIGEGAEYEWQPMDGQFEESKNAILYCCNCLNATTTRIVDTQENKPIWSNNTF